MKLLFFSAFAAALFLPAERVNAGYTVAVRGQGSPAHVLIAGKGSDLKTMFQWAARARAERLLRIYPHHRVVLIAHDEGDNQSQRLAEWGFQVTKASVSTLDSNLLLRNLLTIDAIASLEFFAHISADYGAQLAGGDDRLDPRDQSYAALRGRFIRGAYALFSGCNSGYSMAPWYARLLGIPVIGAFEAVDFERRHENGGFYRFQDGFKPPGEWQRTGAENYRMKPDGFPYIGTWGNYKDGGLGFFKTFCPSGILDAACAQTMAESLMSISSREDQGAPGSREQWLFALKEQMCPTGWVDDSRFRACAEAIDRVVAGGTGSIGGFYQGPTLECDFASCRFKMVRCEPVVPGSFANKCDVERTARDTGTWEREVRAYLAGWQALARNGRRLR